ncbi:MAG: hypothetical protein ILP02_02280 [Clostridia bacterium]|nr:hypothetical protein [Clostridia bacterium]
MSNFLIGFLSIVALFFACLVLSYAAVNLLKPLRRKTKKTEATPKEAVYYVTEKPDRPKPRTLAIKGTLLSQTQLDELTGNGKGGKTVDRARKK